MTVIALTFREDALRSLVRSAVRHTSKGDDEEGRQKRMPLVAKVAKAVVVAAQMWLDCV